MSKILNLADHTSELVRSFRSLYQALEVEARKRVSNLDNFLVPCQVEAVGFEDTQQLFLFVTNFPNLPDLEIVVRGPAPSSKSIEVMEESLASPKWDRLVREDRSPFRFLRPDLKYRDIIEDQFLRMSRYARLPARELSSPIPRSAIAITGKCTLWLYSGRLDSFSGAGVATALIEEAKNPPQLVADQAPIPRLAAWGSFFYPPIWIGDIPEIGFRDRAQGTYDLKPRATAVRSTLAGHPIAVNRAGLICLETEDEALAFKRLNEVMAGGLFAGIPTISIRPPELFSLTLNPSSHEVMGYSARVGTRRAELLELHDPFRIEHLASLRTVDEIQVSHAITYAEKIASSKEASHRTGLLLDSHTHLLQQEFPQALLLSWIALEMGIADSWRGMLKDAHISEARQKKLDSPTYWTTDPKLELLQLLNRISFDDYRSLMEIKKHRNKYVHEGHNITEEMATNAFQKAYSVLQSEFQLRHDDRASP